jgi:uncharacterized protein with PQ loop repeat
VDRLHTGGTLDRLAHLAGPALPLLTIPQAWEVWAGHGGGSLALVTWAAYLVVSLLFVLYGVRHASTLLLVTYVPFVVVEAVIVVGLIVR